MSAGSAYARATSRRGALNSRSMSTYGCPAGAVIFVSATIGPSFLVFLFLFLVRVLLERDEQLVEALVALGPEGPVAGQPVRGVLERLGLEVAEPRGRSSGPRDQAGLLEDLEVARDGRLGHREGSRELGDREVPGGLRQPRQDRPSGRVGERAEDRAERIHRRCQRHL